MKKNKTTNPAWWTLSAFLFFLGFASSLAQPEYSHFRTGALELTEKDREWERKHTIKTEKVPLNKLAISRLEKRLDPINARRVKQGKPPITKDMLRRAREKAPIIGQEGKGNLQGRSFTSEQASAEQIIGELTGVSADAAGGITPDLVDNSLLPSFPPIRSQGGLGSCASFSIAYYQCTHELGLIRGTDNKNENNSTKFSPKFLYNIVNGGLDWGSSYYDNYEVLRLHGVPTWEDFPYQDTPDPPTNYREWPLQGDVWRNAIEYRYEDLFSINNWREPEGLENIKKVLANGHVFIYGTYAYSFVAGIVADDPATSEDDAFAGLQAITHVDGHEGSHAMTLVGYNDHIWIDLNNNGSVDDGEKGALKVANSWGEGWYNQGYAWVAYDALQDVTQVEGGPAGAERNSFFRLCYWMIPRAYYHPKLLARFTANHQERNQLALDLGLSALAESVPTTTWYSALSHRGGAYAFDGTTTACDATFYFDFSDIAPANVEAMKYYLSVDDNYNDGDAHLSEFTLVDAYNGEIETPSGDTPLTVSDGRAYATVTYTFDDMNVPPVASFTLTPVSGSAPLTVTADASASTDADGNIVDYIWDFGDGGIIKGQNVTHTFYQAGEYNVILTVVDNWYAKAVASQSVTVHLSVIDIGNPSLPGSIAENNGVYTMQGGGADIWGAFDQFSMLPESMYGNGQVTIRVASIENTHNWAKAGVMIRETLDPDSKHAMMVVTPSRGVSFQRRTQTGSISYDNTVSGITAPVWLNIRRFGDEFRGFYSMDGQTWTLAGSDTITMNRDVHAGPVVTSHDDTQLATAVFDNYMFYGMADLVYDSHYFYGGNDDGIFSPGETVELVLVFRNEGNYYAPEVQVQLASNNSCVIVENDIASYGDIPEGGYAYCYFTVSADPGCHGVFDAELAYTATDKLGNTWQGTFLQTVRELFSISGVATYKGRPVSEISVYGTNLDDGSSFWALTDSNGFYELMVSEGTIEVSIATFSPSGEYMIAPVTLTVPPAQVLNLDLIAAVEISPETISASLQFNEAQDVPLSIQVNYNLMLDFMATVPGEYSWRSSLDEGGPAYVWEDISAAGTQLTGIDLSNDGIVPLSFGFPFYGETYDTVRVKYQGLLAFDESVSYYYPHLLPNSSDFGARIVGLGWDGITGGSIYYLDDGNKAVFQYQDLQDLWNSEVTYTFQIVLHKSGLIQLFYKEASTILYTAVVGVQNESGDDGLTVTYETIWGGARESFNSGFLRDELAVEIIPAGSWLSLSPMSGTILADSSQTLTASLDAAGLSAGIYHKVIFLASEIYYRTYFIPVELTVGQFTGWAGLDIGTPGVPGSFTETGGVFSVTGGGADIWGYADDFYYVTQAKSGDFSITARVNSVAYTNYWAKAGVMIRENLTDDSKHAMMVATPTGNVSFQYRTHTGSYSSCNTVWNIPLSVWVRVTRKGDVFTGSYSQDGVTWVEVDAVNIEMEDNVNAGLAVTSHNDSVATIAELDHVNIDDDSWTGQDIGTPGVSGSHSEAGGLWTVTGGGNDIWSTSDNFYYVHKQEDGDFILTAKVNSIENTDYWSKAGLMIRETLDPNSINAMILVTGGSNVCFQRRPQTGAYCNSTNAWGIGTPVWLRLGRSGDLITGYYSQDGSTWIEVGETTIAMGERMHVGLAVTSHNDAVAATAILESVELNQAGEIVTGSILREVWTGIPGTFIDDLVNHPKFLEQPDITDELTSFEAPTNLADNYGTRVSGFLVPEVSGDYTFWIASDDNGELLLSTDMDPNNASLIASVPFWTAPRAWDVFSSQKSVTVYLVAGQAYYIEALQKEGGGGDNLAVAWEGPGIPRQVIQGMFLAPYSE